MNPNDEILEDGVIGLEVEPLPANELKPVDETPPFPLIAVSELTENPNFIKFLIKGYLPEKSIIELFGAPGSGKSFVALDMAFCIANGIDWHGRKTKQGAVIYIAGEGYYGLGQRNKALELNYNMPANNLFISKQPASLTDEQNALWVAEAIHQFEPVLIIIDTLSRNFGGGDENSTRDMNSFISNLDYYIKGDAAVLIVHHSGLAEKGRARGSSVLNGAMDAEYCISRAGNTITMTNTKAKEFEPPKDLAFEMTPQELGWTDEDGVPISSVVLNESEWQVSNNEPSKSKPLSAQNRDILTALIRSIELHGIKPGKEITERFGGFGIGNSRKVVHVDYWRKEAYPILDVESGIKELANKRARFNRAKQALRIKHIQTMNDYWWPTYG